MHFVALLIFILLPIAAIAETMETSEIILSIINASDNDEQICRRAKEMTDGNMTKEQCFEKLPASKEFCAETVNNFIGMYVTDEEVARYVVRKIIFCQVWTVLGYETVVDDKGIHYVKKEGGVLP
ncbi:hypothetical protein [Sulfurimonas diazotrophicus]|uniref:Uncharacterized protein n=1 Tax=Sulfurimonas diazotrophicus TaxID=3131939 RepID=A0ABZ3HBI8_9BACT